MFTNFLSKTFQKSTNPTKLFQYRFQYLPKQYFSTNQFKTDKPIIEITPPPQSPPIMPPPPQYTNPQPTQFKPITKPQQDSLEKHFGLNESKDKNVQVVGDLSQFLLKYESHLSLISVIAVTAGAIMLYREIQAEWQRGDAIF